MKVYDILVESKKEEQIDELSPVRWAKAKMGNKSAQLDIEIDKEVKDIYKDFVAVVKQDPKQKGMTVDSISNFLAAKGFANSPKEVKAYIKQDMSLMKKIGKAISSGTKKTIAATGAGLSAAKTGAGKVIDAGKKLAQAPNKSGLAPDPNQGELFKESLLLEAELSGSEIKKVIKRFVQQGFQKQLGGRVKKSSYGDQGSGTAPAQSNTKADAKNMATPTMDIDSAIKFLQSNGYKVTKTKKATA